MSSKTRIMAVALSVVLIASVLGSGAALAADNETVDDADGDELEDASTTVETDDDDDDDLNESDDDLDGNETVDENETGSVPFGMQVSAFVHALIGNSGDDANATNDSNVSIGQRVAAFVTANNPGNAPDHAGPKNDTDSDRGKPAHADSGNETGKPAHAGPGNETDQSDDAADAEESDGGAGGPPADRGNGDSGGNSGPSEAPGRSGDRGGGPPN